MENNKLTLYVPESNNYEIWVKDFNFYYLDTNRYDHVIVDFQNRTFIETDDVVFLACLIEHFHSRGSDISFIGGRRYLPNYIKNIRLIEYWKSDFDRCSYTNPYNSTTLCLWQVSRPMIEGYSNYAREYFERVFFKGKDLIDLSVNLKELFNNIFDHSQSKVKGYAITQYMPKIKKLSISVCDFGIGIPETINSYYKRKGEKTLTDSEALKLSLERGFTVQSTPGNKGMGLSFLKDLVMNYNGELRITSNYAQLVIEKDGDGGFDLYSSEIEVFTPGTMIKAEIDTREFEEIEIDEFDFSDDDYIDF